MYIPEFKGLREFNKIGLKAIILHCRLSPDEELSQDVSLLVKAILSMCPNYMDNCSRPELEHIASVCKPYNCTWRYFEEYSRYNFQNFDVEII